MLESNFSNLLYSSVIFPITAISFVVETVSIANEDKRGKVDGLERKSQAMLLTAISTSSIFFFVSRSVGNQYNDIDAMMMTTITMMTSMMTMKSSSTTIPRT